MEHDERMLAIERGVDIPLSPSSTPKKSRHYNPYLWPFILIGLGIALVFSDMLGGHFDFGSKMIPLMIGVAMLIGHATHSKYKKKHGIDEIEDESKNYMMNSKARIQQEDEIDRAVDSRVDTTDSDATKSGNDADEKKESDSKAV